MSATPQLYEQEFLSPVIVGYPDQMLSLEIDTGSADLWVVGARLASSGGQTAYDPGKSEYAEYTLDVLSVPVSDGSFGVSGIVCMDIVTVAGIAIQRQAAQVAEVELPLFRTDKGFSGVLGLAFSSSNSAWPQKQNSFFGNARPLLDAPVFTADLKHGARRFFLCLHSCSVTG